MVGRALVAVEAVVGVGVDVDLAVDARIRQGLGDRGDLILHFIVSWTDSDSNVRASDRSSPFNYDKIVAGIQFEWRF